LKENSLVVITSKLRGKKVAATANDVSYIDIHLAKLAIFFLRFKTGQFTTLV
jgi:hypothetical protein